MKAFKEHPASVGESYFQHMRSSFSFGIKMLGGSFACFAHGIFPFLCVSRGSEAIADLHETMIKHRHRDCGQSEDTQKMEDIQSLEAAE